MPFCLWYQKWPLSYSYVAISTGAHSSTLASSRNQTWNRSIPLCHHTAATLSGTEKSKILSKIPDSPPPPYHNNVHTCGHQMRVYFSKTHMHTWYTTWSQCKLGMKMTIKLYSYIAISTRAHSSTLASSRNRTWNRSIPLCHHIAATLFETEESKIPNPPSPPQYITICTYIRICDHQMRLFFKNAHAYVIQNTITM